MPGVDRERDIQKSMCTLGLSDFHSMQNININVLSELLMQEENLNGNINKIWKNII